MRPTNDFEKKCAFRVLKIFVILHIFYLPCLTKLPPDSPSAVWTRRYLLFTAWKENMVREITRSFSSILQGYCRSQLILYPLCQRMALQTTVISNPRLPIKFDLVSNLILTRTLSSKENDNSLY